MTTFYQRLVVYHAANGATLTYVCSSEGRELPPAPGLLRRGDGFSERYPPDWLDIFLMRFNPQYDTLLCSDPISERQFLDIAKRAPKLVIESDFVIHDLSHLEGNNENDNNDDAERDS